MGKPEPFDLQPTHGGPHPLDLFCPLLPVLIHVGEVYLVEEQELLTYEAIKAAMYLQVGYNPKVKELLKN